MNCAYHINNASTANCNGCGRPLCPACDHRVKGFPFCTDCIVQGVDLLRQQNRADNAPFVKKRTSPFVAGLLSFICTGLGQAYNGQTVKALVYFAVSVGLFQMAVLTSGTGITPVFVLSFMGMWFFGMLDAWRTAQMIRSGVTPDMADDILVKRFSGNTKLWGGVMLVLGVGFVIQRVFGGISIIMRGLVPLMLIGLGAYLLRGYVFKGKTEERWSGAGPSTSFSLTSARNIPSSADYNVNEFADRGRSGSWRDV
jgi:TM2 domain-containing membrane protein YozV